MNPLNDLGANFQQASIVNLILSGVVIWSILSVVGVAIYRLFRGSPADTERESVMSGPKKKKRG